MRPVGLEADAAEELHRQQAPTPAAYRVTGIPTLNVFQNGELVKQIVGAKPKAALLGELSDFIG